MPEHRLTFLGTTYTGVMEFGCTDCDWKESASLIQIGNRGRELREAIERRHREAHATADSRELECMVAAGWLTQEEVHDAQ